MAIVKVREDRAWIVKRKPNFIWKPIAGITEMMVLKHEARYDFLAADITYGIGNDWLVQDRMLLHAIHGEFQAANINIDEVLFGQTCFALYLNDVLIRKWGYGLNLPIVAGSNGVFVTTVDETNIYLPLEPDDRLRLNMIVLARVDASVADTLHFTFFKEA